MGARVRQISFVSEVETVTETSAIYSRQKSLQTLVERSNRQMSATAHSCRPSVHDFELARSAGKIHHELLIGGKPSLLVCHGSPYWYDVRKHAPEVGTMTKVSPLHYPTPFTVRSTAFAYREYYDRDKCEILLSRWRCAECPSAVTQARDCTTRPAQRP
jgi:hypothetical protein